MIVVYTQCMLIVVFGSARVVDPGGSDTMDKKPQDNLVKQQNTAIHPNI